MQFIDVRILRENVTVFILLILCNFHSVKCKYGEKIDLGKQGLKV